MSRPSSCSLPVVTGHNSKPPCGSSRHAWMSFPILPPGACASSATQRSCRPVCAHASTAMGCKWMDRTPQNCSRRSGLPAANSCEFRRMWSLGSRPGPASATGSSAAANTKQGSRMAAIRSTSHAVRFSPISAKACCTSPSASARCWPTRWGSARPSRRSPRAHCSTASARRGASWSSRPPR